MFQIKEGISAAANYDFWMRHFEFISSAAMPENNYLLGLGGFR